MILLYCQLISELEVEVQRVLFFPWVVRWWNTLYATRPRR